MTKKDQPSPADQAGVPDASDEQTRRVVHFAQYTSPVMLAMLASAGKDAALAQTAA